MSGGGPCGSPFDALPEDVLNHVLSFLPSRKAVEASLLASPWRHLWRSTLAVRVGGKGDAFRFFVSSLIVHRNVAPLRSLEIDAADLVIQHEYPYNDPEFSFGFEDTWNWRGKVDRHLDLWVTHALSSCHARSLTARFKDARVPWRPRSAFTFASTHLTTAHLDAVHLVDGLLDFSCCPALRSLALVNCRLQGDALVSPSLDRLALVDCHSNDKSMKYFDFDPEFADERLQIGISTPRLRFLEISDNYDKEQFLDMMPWLTQASIKNILSQWNRPARMMFS